MQWIVNPAKFEHIKELDCTQQSSVHQVAANVVQGMVLGKRANIYTIV